MTKRRRPSAARKVADARFWGHSPDAEGSTEGQRPHPQPIRPTPDPAAVVRSLGATPLALDQALAERHLTAVYEEAVRTATALAAANRLLAPEAEGRD